MGYGRQVARPSDAVKTTQSAWSSACLAVSGHHTHAIATNRPSASIWP